jgi:hypothetical protein
MQHPFTFDPLARPRNYTVRAKEIELFGRLFASGVVINKEWIKDLAMWVNLGGQYRAHRIINISAHAWERMRPLSIILQ